VFAEHAGNSALSESGSDSRGDRSADLLKQDRKATGWLARRDSMPPFAIKIASLCVAAATPGATARHRRAVTLAETPLPGYGYFPRTTVDWDA